MTTTTTNTLNSALKVPPIAMSKLYIGNLPLDTNEHTLRELFAQEGVTCTNISLKRGGYAFIDCPDQSSADKAIDKLCGYRLNGRLLVVEPSLAPVKKRNSLNSIPDVLQRVHIGNGWMGTGISGR